MALDIYNLNTPLATLRINVAAAKNIQQNFTRFSTGWLAQNVIIANLYLAYSATYGNLGTGIGVDLGGQ